MVHPTGDEIRRLKAVAWEMSEGGGESGHLVGVATSQHPSFTNSSRPAGWLERELFLDAARRAAQREGFAVESDNGAFDVVSVGNSRIRKYRVKRGHRTAGGDYRFVCGLGSTLLTTECDLLYVEERWILGYFSTDDHTIDEIIAAEVVGGAETRTGPVLLRLGAIVNLLDSSPAVSHEFVSTDEGLFGFDNDEDEGETGIA